MTDENGLIFVGIPCYRDDEIIPTLNSLILNCDDPSKLRIGLFLQVDANEDSKIISDINELIKQN